jgi:hypothetical protein
MVSRTESVRETMPSYCSLRVQRCLKLMHDFEPVKKVARLTVWSTARCQEKEKEAGV